MITTSGSAVKRPEEKRPKPLPKLILIGVSSCYHGAFSNWAAGQEIDVVSCDKPIGFKAASDPALCVYESPAPENLVDRIHALRKSVRSAPLVILSPAISMAETVELIEAGVRDVIQIPDSATKVVARAAARATSINLRSPDRPLIGRSFAMRNVRRELAAVAPTDSVALITGETGSGKGLAARFIHDLSRRNDHPFIQVDCSSLSESLIESELFGHERGAFTGATGARVGRFEAAERGTIFLDEIGELNMTLQSKLLRVLHDCVYERVGESKARTMSARVVAATNRDLEAEVRAGRFREDLFFRLNVFRVEMPPIRERLEDLPSLVEAGLEKIAARLMVRVPALPDSFCERLATHSWPGNVRELMNLLERFLVQHHAGLLDASKLADLLDFRHHELSPSPCEPQRLPTAGSDAERAVLAEALAATGGNISRVARRLGLARSTLRYRLNLHDLGSLIPID
jgi:DNA-binding NtrC family response regulator